MNDTTELLSRLRVGSITLENLPAAHGYNGALLTIDDFEASHIAKAIDEAVELLSSQSDEEKTQSDYEHFLSYSGLYPGNELLRFAYFHGADIGLDRPSEEARNAIPNVLDEMKNYECRDTDTYSIELRIEDWHDRIKAAI